MTTSSPLRLYETLAKVRNLNEFAPLREWLLEERDATVLLMTNSNDDRTMHLAQGALRALNKFQELIDKSASLVDKGRG